MLRISQRVLRPHTRSIWTTTTLTSSSASSLLSSLPPRPTSSQFTLYTLSKHFPQSLLPTLQSSLPHSIGCLSEPLLSSSSSSSSPPYTLSLAHWSPSSPQEKLIEFSTTLTGRPNVSLGREHKPRAGGRMSEMELEFEERQFEKFLKGDKGWAFGDSVEAIKGTGLVGEEKRGVVVEELRDVKPEDVKQIICFTADRIQPFLSALSAYPNSSTLGMTSTSTPFHSAQNHPFSLFHNSTTTSIGAVGVAIVDSSSSSSTSTATSDSGGVKIDYGNLEQFGSEVEVTSARGNIILTFSSENAASHLLSLVQSLPSSSPLTGTHTDSSSPFEASLSNPNERTTKHISKDKDFYAAIFSGEEMGKEGTRRELGQAKLVCRIMAGDPKRGAVSFETEEEIKKGDKVIFLHRPESSIEESGKQLKGFQFKTVEASYVPPQATPNENEGEGQVREMEGVFWGMTENGVVVSRRSEIGTEVRLAGIEGTRVGLEV